MVPIPTKFDHKNYKAFSMNLEPDKKKFLNFRDPRLFLNNMKKYEKFDSLTSFEPFRFSRTFFKKIYILARILMFKNTEITEKLSGS